MITMVILIGIFALVMLWVFQTYPNDIGNMLIKQYGLRTGRLVSVALLVLFILGAVVFAWLQRGWLFSLFRTLQ